jgi:hypothetical protein
MNIEIMPGFPLNNTVECEGLGNGPTLGFYRVDLGPFATGGFTPSDTMAFTFTPNESFNGGRVSVVCMATTGKVHVTHVSLTALQVENLTKQNSF